MFLSFFFLITCYTHGNFSRWYIESRTEAHKFAFISMQGARQEVSMEPVLLHEWLNIAENSIRHIVDTVLQRLWLFFLRPRLGES